MSNVPNKNSNTYKSLGDFILLEMLNSGGMAEVWLAKTVVAGQLSKFFAVKVILGQHAQNPDYIKMFKGEAKVAINLQHNNVVSILDFKAENNKLYLVMEYLAGHNLLQVLRKLKDNAEPLPLEYILFIIREIALAMDYAHTCVDPSTGLPLKIIHRDMTPQNIMISYSGAIKLIDFGIAKADQQTRNTSLEVIKGNCSYMSPEQALGNMELNATTDIFSLGIIFWELLTGSRLFHTGDEYTTYEKVKACIIPDLRIRSPHTPDEVERIVKKCLYVDREIRYQHAGDLAKDLTHVLNQEFPKFMPSDFADFIKLTFAEEAKEMSEKLKMYSKVTQAEKPKSHADGGRYQVEPDYSVPDPSGMGKALGRTKALDMFGNEEVQGLPENFAAVEPQEAPINLNQLKVATSAPLFTFNAKPEPPPDVDNFQVPQPIREGWSFRPGSTFLYLGLAIFVYVSIFFMPPDRYVFFITTLKSWGIEVPPKVIRSKLANIHNGETPNRQVSSEK